MNKKYLYLSLLSIGLIACGETETTEDSHNSEVETTESVEIVEEIVEDEIESEINFSKFEDYATIENKTDLIERFGKENTEDKVAWYAEGTTKKESTILTNPDNGHIVKFVWDDENDYKLDWIEASYYEWGDDYENMGSQVIEAENGLSLGMSLKDLVAWNGADFEFSGFGWDFGGSVSREDGSKISNSDIIIRLMDAQIDTDYDQWSFMQGDHTLKTDDPKLKDAPVLIEQFTLFVDNE